jgi:large subunit ribosomal protein L25
MDKSVLKAETRDKSVKANAIRRQGLIPAEYYGRGIENLSLQMDYQEFRKLYREAGENTIIELKVEGSDDKKVLVHQVTYDPVSDEFTHVEFINVRMDEEVTTHVAIHLEGQAPAVKELAGVLMQNLDQLEVRCLPGNLIHEVTVSIESLVDFNAAVHVSDITVPETITVLTDPDTTVATVTAPREEELEELPEEDVAGVEVEGEEGAEGEEGEGGDEKKEGGDEAKEEGGE